MTFILPRLVFFLILVLITCSSCLDNVRNPNKELTLDDFSKLSDDRFKLDSRKIRKNIARLIEADGIMLPVDRLIRGYYLSEKPYIWINRLGIQKRADSLLVILENAGTCGVNTKILRVKQLKDDLYHMRTLQIDAESGDINMLMARLEYNLTRSYLRYSSILRFGISNPDYLYNNFEKLENDSVSERYRQLSDLRIERPNAEFIQQALAKALNDSINDFFVTLQPKSKLYRSLLNLLGQQNLKPTYRMKLLCNIERCRWRLMKFPDNEIERRIEANIPSYSVRAIDNGNVLYMRMACGALKHKTPLLASNVMRMDINPQWIVPKSIAKGFIHRPEYMHRMGMFVYDKKEGRLSPEQASYERMMNGEQYIIQSGGPKNSLGRIIFRFDNGFSVFLHDTSSPGVFKRAGRAVSHGCIRVEKPYELALFLMKDEDDELADKLKYSMTVNLFEDNDSIPNKNIDKKKMVRTLYVKPPVPIFITYYTIYYDESGHIVDYQDVYGYDAALEKQLKPFVE